MMNKPGIRAVLISAVIAICCTAAQRAHAIENDPGIWTIFSTTAPFPGEAGSGNWHYWFDAQARYFDPGSGTNQWLVRPGVGYEIREGVKVWAGYARIRSRGRTGLVANENRYWQQIDWRAGQMLGGQVTLRVRLEQRSIDIGDDLGVVLRFATKYVRPISANGDTRLIVGLEPFIDLRDTDWGGDAGMGQNRTYLGLSRRISNKLTLEVGYMHQYIFRDSGQDRLNHLALLSIKAKL